MTSKIKILFLAANPIDTGTLQLQKEARELQERIRQGPHRDDFEVIHYLAARPEDLLRGLQDIQPHILHFSGHGTYNNEIVLQGDDGTSRPVAPEDLADLVGLFKNNLKLALLSSCFARRQAEALHGVLDFTIGMDKPISDEGAVSYSAAFYQVLASGGSINQAFHAARLVTSMEGRPVFEKSDLLVRPGANADQPFIEVLPSVRLRQPGPPQDGNGAHITIENVSGEIVSAQSGAGNTMTNTVIKK
ncbi:MAG: hypothetical protein QOG23_1956 [Blastocatellia bacterium]|jgi:hypothetical protein|nr:hypothetical protein [Blastocatellia bacterium]